MNNQLQAAVQVLNKGGIIIFPTDTAFGIGCRIDKINSIERLFNIRKRPETQATPVLVSSTQMARRYAKEIPVDVEEKLIKRYWPGALTIILPANLANVAELVKGGGKNIGLRIPNNKIILEIIEKVGVPILGPSANFHGEKTPYSIEELDKELVKQVDLVIEGECSVKKASTVVDCSIKPWRVIREGAIKEKEMPSFKNVILLINTSKTEEVEIGVVINGKKKILNNPISIKKREIVLNLIDQLLKAEKLNIYDVTSIKVEQGPGSFTGLRVGISVANALATLLKISVNGQKIGDLENAVYN